MLGSSSTALAVSLAEPANMGTWALIKGASGVVIGVMVLLAIMSLMSWYIIGYKYLFISTATQARPRRSWTPSGAPRTSRQIYKVAQGLGRSPLSHLFLAGYTELSKLQSGGAHVRRPGRAISRTSSARCSKATTKEITKLEASVPFLATTGSAAPFIGLFGTVWGIMNAFHDIGAQRNANLGDRRARASPRR